MIYESSTSAAAIFFIFVGVTLAISFYLGGKAKSSQGYFAAHGEIPWFINGVAFAGDYLSAASFLGICGMIALYGYDGFLYSIGFLAGWIVALLVVAEPMKRMGKFTFADALDSRFQSKGIKIAVGISTLVVSVFYLIPQMVGAGALITPLLGFDHWVGVLIVGVTVITIVVTAGMVSTTYVQFIKGALLVVFSAVLTVVILQRGFDQKKGGEDGYEFSNVGPVATADIESSLRQLDGMDDAELLAAEGDWKDQPFIRFSQGEKLRVWHVVPAAEPEDSENVLLREAQTLQEVGGKTLVNGEEKGKTKGEAELHPIGHVSKLPGGQEKTGPLGPLSFFSTLQKSEVVLWRKQVVGTTATKTTVFYQEPTHGSEVLSPGGKFKGIREGKLIGKINFLSLMLALFCGTASLPHILIRYYTVKDASAARKSTIVGIATIGFFYVLTLYLGLGAMTSGALDVSDSGNMAAPLLAKSMSPTLFAIISAIAFTTVLGTVSGLILASAGAVTHDLMASGMGIKMGDEAKVRVAKISSVVVGAIAIVLGIQFKGMNVGFLVGWAFSIAASANLPALVMLLFWKGTTKQGIITAVVVGMVTSLGWILLSADTMQSVYGISDAKGFVPFGQPGIVTIPLGFLTLIVVSLMTKDSSGSEK
jgi:cation/acetate symporter